MSAMVKSDGGHKWVMMPTGRWATTMNSYGGWIVLHAFVSGAWAITRGHSREDQSGAFVMGSREGLQQGEDLESAMRIAEEHGLKFVESENPDKSRHGIQLSIA